MEIKFKVFRYLPNQGNKPHYDTYIMEVDPNDRVLDVLEQVRADSDPSLAYRRSCAHGVCGSDAMRINGRNALACKVLVKDLGTNEITVEPILGLKVHRDLIVDMDPFFEHFKSVQPFFINNDPLPEDGKERLQSPVQRERFDDTTKCILCAACTTSCPSFWSNGEYIGPAAIVNAHRFIYDSRDTAAAERLEILNEQMGVWRCRTAFNCTEACPRDIEITHAIADVKKAIISGKLE